jgi:hypothetical protein
LCARMQQGDGLFHRRILPALTLEIDHQVF